MDSEGVNCVQLGPPAAQDQLSMSFRLGTNLNIGTRGPQGRLLEVHDILLTHTLVGGERG